MTTPNPTSGSRPPTRSSTPSPATAHESTTQDTSVAPAFAQRQISEYDLAMRMMPPAIDCCAPLAAPVLDEHEAAATAALFEALGDPARVRIVNLLATSDEPVCVCNLAEPLGLSQPTVVASPEEAASTPGSSSASSAASGRYFSLSPEAVERVRARSPTERSVLLMATTADELREEVRRRYAESARAVTDGVRGLRLRQRLVLRGRRERRDEVRRGALRRRAARRAARRRPCSRRSAAATRPRSPSCARARRCSTSAPAAAST